MLLERLEGQESENDPYLDRAQVLVKTILNEGDQIILKDEDGENKRRENVNEGEEGEEQKEDVQRKDKEEEIREKEEEKDNDIKLIDICEDIKLYESERNKKKQPKEKTYNGRLTRGKDLETRQQQAQISAFFKKNDS